MSSDPPKITKDNLRLLLSELGKDYRKRSHGHGQAELILVGGAVIVSYYAFRLASFDIDGIIDGDDELRDSIRAVGNKENLDPKWLNDDFKMTTSYSPKLVLYSQYYGTFSNCLKVRRVVGPYLIAVKLRSFRPYRDLSDIVGIIKTSKEKGEILSLETVLKAYRDLYGSKEVLPPEKMEFLDRVFASQNLSHLYETVIVEEKANRETLVELDKEESQVLHQMDNIQILEEIRKRQGKK